MIILENSEATKGRNLAEYNRKYSDLGLHSELVHQISAGIDQRSMCKCSELARPITCQETTGNQPSRPGEFNNEFVRPINDENSAEHYICNGVLSCRFLETVESEASKRLEFIRGDQRLVRNCESHKFKLILFGARPDQRFICKCVETPKCNRWTNGRINTGTKTANYMFLTTLLVGKKYSLCRSHACLAVEGRTMTYQHTSRHRQ